MLESDQLRDAKIAAGIVDSLDDAGEILDSAKINPVDESQIRGESKGMMLEISGAIARSRVQRWQSNLDSTLSGGDINTWVI